RPITGRPAIVWALLDAMLLARRSVLRTWREPQLIVFVAIQPVMFVVLFRYVFGGAIQVPGGQYVNYLKPGIFVQTVAFGGVITAIGLAEDMQRGLIDRFRSLPMSSSAVVRAVPWPIWCATCSRLSSCWLSDSSSDSVPAAPSLSLCSRSWS